MLLTYYGGPKQDVTASTNFRFFGYGFRWIREGDAQGPYKKCLAISRNARLLYPTKLPRRPFAIEAVTGQSRPKCIAAKTVLFDHLVGERK
jgi:hypothetical protein